MRIVEELTTKCGVTPPPPSHITPEICNNELLCQSRIATTKDERARRRTQSDCQLQWMYSV
jgi:hypothetical protein